MPTVRNKSPRGDLDVPLLRRVVARGETVEVSAEQAKRLLAQADNFELVERERKHRKKGKGE